VELAKDPYGGLKAADPLWHVYKEPHAPTAFNPNSNGRFSARTAATPRAMFYAGSSADCALWETLLRDVVPMSDRSRYVQLPPAAGYSLAQVRLRRDVPILDLSPLKLRGAVFDRDWRDRLLMLTTVPKYAATHKAAVQLLDAAPKTSGLSWRSRQTGEELAYVFYGPPVSNADIELIETIPLESPVGCSCSKRRWRAPACNPSTPPSSRQNCSSICRWSRRLTAR